MSSGLIKTIQLFGRIAVVDIAAKIAAKKPVGAVFDTPEDIEFVKSQSDFVS